MCENIEYTIVHESILAAPIFDIVQQRLLTPARLKSLSKTEFNDLKNEGFVIGDHSIEQIEEWIMDEKNLILIAKEQSPKKPINVIGYTFILASDDIKQRVRGYGEDVAFETQEYENLLFKKDFVYLIQLAVSRNYENRGIGSKMLQNIYERVELPIISFIMKSPIPNEPSLYVHLKNGFDYFGDYLGEYNSFENYRSIGLVHSPGKKKRGKKEAKKLMEFIYNNK
jgi:ribosomal protein S18 acetylase RimI-like enzyme